MIHRLQPDDLRRYQASLSDAYHQFKRTAGEANPAHFLDSWQTFYNIGIGQLFGDLHEGRLTASLGAVISPDLYDAGLIAVCIFWNKRVDAPYGWHRLFDAYEEWAHERKARSIYLTRWSRSPEMGNFFNTVLGYHDSEVHHRKDLSSWV